MVSTWCNVYTCRGRLEYSYEGVWSLHGVMYIHVEGGWSIHMRGCGLYMMLITVKSLSPSLPLSLSARLFTVAVEVKDTQSKLSIATTSTLYNIK